MRGFMSAVPAMSAPISKVFMVNSSCQTLAEAIRERSVVREEV